MDRVTSVDIFKELGVEPQRSYFKRSSSVEVAEASGQDAISR